MVRKPQFGPVTWLTELFPNRRPRGTPEQILKISADIPGSSVNPISQTRYGRQLSERRDVARIEQLANFGLALGWFLTLWGGFCWFCVISHFDGLWLAMWLVGLCLLVISVVISDVLEVPCRLWMKLAHVQGWLVMTLMLTIIYFTLITPAGWLLRRRRGTHPFYSWATQPPAVLAIGWEPLAVDQTSHQHSTMARRRSLLTLLLSTVGFFYGRGHYLVLPILVLLLVLGVVLFFVQGSVLAPFIYTLF